MRSTRGEIDAKLRELPEPALSESALPSGWTPLELTQHLVFMERRWIVWGFLGEDVPDPFGDRSDGTGGGAWAVAPGVTLDELLGRLHVGGLRTRDVLLSQDLTEVAPPGPRFSSKVPQDLRWICFHLLQEYARHAGHLDIVVELAGRDRRCPPSDGEALLRVRRLSGGPTSVIGSFRRRGRCSHASWPGRGARSGVRARP